MSLQREANNIQYSKKKAVAGTAQNPMRSSRSETSAITGLEITGWRRMESRSEPGRFYYWHEKHGKSMLEPPPPWEKIASRSRSGEWYYFNWRNGQTSWIKPEIEEDDLAKDRPVVPALHLLAENGISERSSKGHLQEAQPQPKKGKHNMGRAKSEGALEEPRKDKERGKLCHHHKAHLLGGIVARDDTPRCAPKQKKIVQSYGDSRFPNGLDFLPEETPRDYEHFKQKRMYCEDATKAESLRGHNIVRHHTAREERRANNKDSHATALKGATFSQDQSPKPRKMKKSSKYAEARSYLIGGNWDPEAPDETPFAPKFKQIGVEEEAEPHLFGGVLVRSPQGPFKTAMDEFLALGPEDRSPETTPRELPRGAQSHLWGAHVICDDKCLRKDPQKQFFHKAVRANIKGAGAIMVDPVIPTGIKTFAPRSQRIEGTGAVAVGETETRLIARFLPSTQKAKQLDPGEPRDVALHRRRHFSEDIEWVGDHLTGSGAHVTSEPEERLLYCGGYSRDVPCTSRKWFPDFDHLSGAGIDQVHDLAPRAQDLPQHDESEHHRKWFPDGDHLRGAGMDTILDLTPRDKGKRCPQSVLPQMAEEWKWWEFKEFADASTEFGSPVPPQASPRSSASFQSARTPPRSGRRPKTPPRFSVTPRRDAPTTPTESRPSPRNSEAAWSIPRSESMRRTPRRSDLASMASYDSRASPRSRQAWSSPRSASTPGSRVSSTWLDMI